MNAKEEVELYDENRNKLGRTKVRYRDTLDKGEFIIATQLTIINSKKEILISLRSKEKDKFPLMWECNGGAVKKGESSIEGLKREIYEELGLKIDENEVVYLRTARNSFRFKDMYFLYKDIDINEIDFKDGESIEVKWVSIDEFIDLFNKR